MIIIKGREPASHERGSKKQEAQADVLRRDQPVASLACTMRSPPLHLAMLMALLAASDRHRSASALSSSPSSTSPKPKRYNYFAYGSNMCSDTMGALRNLNPLASTAAVLPNHELRFNVPGMKFIEPSWASVEPVAAGAEGSTLGSDDAISELSVVHGVLYSLTEQDFVSVCRTEGVPMAYTLHRCRVIPYKGNGNNAGRKAMQDESSKSIPAYTLRAASKALRAQPRSDDAAPSQSYVNVLIRGAKEFGLDADYVQMLENMPTGRTLGGGTAERMLEAAIKRRDLVG